MSEIPSACRNEDDVIAFCVHARELGWTPVVQQAEGEYRFLIRLKPPKGVYPRDEFGQFVSNCFCPLGFITWRLSNGVYLDPLFACGSLGVPDFMGGDWHEEIMEAADGNPSSSKERGIRERMLIALDLTESTATSS